MHKRRRDFNGRTWSPICVFRWSISTLICWMIVCRCWKVGARSFSFHIKQMYNQNIYVSMPRMKSEKHNQSIFLLKFSYHTYGKWLKSYKQENSLYISDNSLAKMQNSYPLWTKDIPLQSTMKMARQNDTVIASNLYPSFFFRGVNFEAAICNSSPKEVP